MGHVVSVAVSAISHSKSSLCAANVVACEYTQLDILNEGSLGGRLRSGSGRSKLLTKGILTRAGVP